MVTLAPWPLHPPGLLAHTPTRHWDNGQLGTLTSSSPRSIGTHTNQTLRQWSPWHLDLFIPQVYWHTHQPDTETMVNLAPWPLHPPRSSDTHTNQTLRQWWPWHLDLFIPQVYGHTSTRHQDNGHSGTLTSSSPRSIGVHKNQIVRQWSLWHLDLFIPPRL